MGLYIIDIIFIAALTGVSYISTVNLYVTLAVFLASSLYFFLVFNLKIKKYFKNSERYHECYQFINTFIISLSVTNSIIQAFERATLNISKSFRLELKGIEQLEEIEKIKYLKKYFPFHVYQLFLNILDLFIEQGGDILKMSRYLLKEARLIEEYIDAIRSASSKRLIELLILWTLALGILIFIRFGLSQFFDSIAKSSFYPISVGGFFVFVLLAIDISVTRLFKIKIRGFKIDEKINKRIKSKL